MSEQFYYLTYILDDNREVGAKFDDLDNREGCHISLDMYKSNIGPVTEEVWQRFVGKFRGELLEKE